jgi:hypothetical protein
MATTNKAALRLALTVIALSSPLGFLVGRS